MDSNNIPITVEMTRQDAALFILFQKYYNQFGFITASNVWDIRNGSATLNFDMNGNIKNIKKELYTYNNSNRPGSLVS